VIELALAFLIGVIVGVAIVHAVSAYRWK